MQTKDHIGDCIGLLKQAAEIVAQLDDCVFRALTPLSSRGSIGGHLRHLLDFYSSFTAGCRQSRINYNERVRDSRVEQDRFHAVMKINACVNELNSLALLPAHEHLLVCTEDGSSWSRSSVLRELDFLRSHTIHHYALIAMLLRMHEVDPGEEFGVAPSTLKHWKQETVCAQ